MRTAAMFLSALLFCCCREPDATPGAGAATDAVSSVEPGNAKPPAADTILAERYANGTMKYVALAKDSGECRELHQGFYENGRLKFSGCQGHVENADLSTGMSVGTWSYYDSSSGRLDSTFFFDNSELEKAFILKKTFYPDGSVKAEETWNNWMLYETEPRRKGIWKYYAENGKVSRTVTY